MKTEERQPSKGVLLDRPYIYDDEERERVWREKWPNAHFALVHKYNPDGRENLSEIWRAEAAGYQVLTEDQSIVRHAGHVLMGINAEYRADRDQEALDRFNRRGFGKERSTEDVGDAKDAIIFENTRESSGTIDDLMN